MSCYFCIKYLLKLKFLKKLVNNQIIKRRGASDEIHGQIRFIYFLNGAEVFAENLEYIYINDNSIINTKIKIKLLQFKYCY